MICAASAALIVLRVIKRVGPRGREQKMMRKRILAARDRRVAI